MSVADRDLTWTEWVRTNADAISEDIQHLARSWRQRPTRSAADRLRARWVLWALTTTARAPRCPDKAAMIGDGHEQFERLVSEARPGR